MRPILFVAAPLLILAQDVQNSNNSTSKVELKASSAVSITEAPTSSANVNNAQDNAAGMKKNVKSMSVIGASDDTIIVFLPTTASMTITERSTEQLYTTFTKVSETTFVSVSISVHATTLLPTIRRPMLQGADDSNSGSMNSEHLSTFSMLLLCMTTLFMIIIM